MFKSLSIRNRIVISITVLLLINSGSIFLLIKQAEKKLYNTIATTEKQVLYDYARRKVLVGDIYEILGVNVDYITMENHNSPLELFPTLRGLTIKISIIFGITVVIGVLISIFLSRSISKPIMELAQETKNFVDGKPGKTKEFPQYPELQLLSDSYKKMREGLFDHEEEKRRQERVETTKNLAAGIAHEIKNPINTVGLIADYLQTNLSPDNPGKRYEFYKLTENMRSELKRINRIVEGFLRLTRPEKYNFRREDINSIINYSVSTLEPEVIKHNIKVNQKLAAQLPAIKVDKDRMNQVFSNLLINAVEAMPRGGEIMIFSGTNDGQKVEIQVSDNGIGIPPENLRKIFSPYYSTKEQGFGLGLSLTHNIIHKHRGKIAVSSEKGKGTMFTIQLPVDFTDE
jgi:signal transduction histidine kinase